MSTAPYPVHISDSAAFKVSELIADEGNPDLKLRIYVSGGGCSGFQYGFAFEETTGIDDLVMEKRGVRVLIDPLSLQYLSGAEVDYQEGLEGSRFVIKNPNAKSTCGCGSSFTTAETGESNGHPTNGKSCASSAAVPQ